MTLTGMLSDSFYTIWNYPKAILPYLLVELLLTALILPIYLWLVPGAALHAGHAITSILGAVIGIIAISFVVGIFITPLFYGMYTNLEIQKLKKASLSLNTAYNAAKSRYWSLVWAGFLSTLIYLVIVLLFVVLILAFAVLFAHASLATAVTSSLGHFANIIGAMILWVILLVACLVIAAVLLFQWVPALMVEKIGGAEAIKRSISIGKRNFWDILGLFVIFYIIVLAVYLVAGLISVPFDLINHTLGTTIQLLLSAVIGSFICPWLVALMTSFYNSYVKKIR